MSSQVASLEAELKEIRLQLETVQSGIQADPDNHELLGLKSELEELIELTETDLADKRRSEPQPLSKNTSTPATKEKWSREKHPAFQPGYKRPTAPESPTQESQSSATFSVNDTVLAKWISGDKSFYPARITSITGSSNSPVYIVSFKSYGTTETLRAHDIKPISNKVPGQDSKKRNADTLAPTPVAPSPALNSAVISAAADINPALADQIRNDPSKTGEGTARPAKVQRKVKANKELEAGKNKWKDFASKGKLGKVAKKESMFRTPEGVNGRVGFTGSGQSMRKDAARSRHIYQQGGEDEGY
ncbi:MAG: hypothetical protein M1829_002822 [Trizodia sp. TS-e1964]|nr:MAG: hypothetical protein M1829_002822 [Trizodia sp. TS-e1964]